MEKTINFILALLLVSSLHACAKETGPQGEKPLESSTAMIEASEDHWTYFSFVTGEVVGTSRLGSSAEDGEWASRSDWDIALCRDMIRTNSGTSGQGNGGIIMIDNTEFGDIDHAPASGYQADRDDIVIR